MTDTLNFLSFSENIIDPLILLTRLFVCSHYNYTSSYRYSTHKYSAITTYIFLTQADEGDVVLAGGGCTLGGGRVYTVGGGCINKNSCSSCKDDIGKQHSVS
jgi:hypothetical protein